MCCSGPTCYHSTALLFRSNWTAARSCSLSERRTRAWPVSLSQTTPPSSRSRLKRSRAASWICYLAHREMMMKTPSRPVSKGWRATMSIELEYLEEPRLQFGQYFEHQDSKTGLAEFGPFGKNKPGLHPSEIKLGFIGTRD